MWRSSLLSVLSLLVLALAAPPDVAAAEAAARQGSAGQAAQVIRPADLPTTTAIDLFVMPHPDDELEVWSMVEASTDSYKVFLYLGRGESTPYCTPTKFTSALRTKYNELVPDPKPVNKWVPSCPQARLDSTLGFYRDMAAVNPAFPDPSTTARVVDLPADATVVRHCEGYPFGCTVDRTAIVHDAGSKGMVIFLALGDGDTMPAEIVWGIRSVIAQRDALGMPADLPIRDIIGGYYGRSRNTACSQYRQVDHGALRSVLYNVDFQTSGHQYGATCRYDSRARLTKYVSPQSWKAAMEVNRTTHQRYGAMQRRYGWMNAALNGWYYSPLTTTQKVTFMRRQSFWRRY